MSKSEVKKDLGRVLRFRHIFSVSLNNFSNPKPPLNDYFPGN